MAELTKDFLEKQIEDLQGKITEKVGGVKSEIEKDLDERLKTLETLSTKDELQKAMEEIEAQKQRIDKLAEAKDKKKTASTPISFEKGFAENLAENHENLTKTYKSNGKANMVIEKATINTNNSLTGGLANDAGGALINQLNQGIILPSQLVNFDQLINVVQGSEDTIRYWREVASTNSIDTPASKGALKPETTFDFDPQTETADYTAGIYAFHKSMFRNLPWMQARLPQMLRRDFYKKQNADYYTKLTGAIGSATLSAGDDGVIALVKAIGELEASDYPANGIVLDPADWANISITRDNDNGFTLPSTVTFEGGVLRINGVPVFKATWVTAGEFVVGDWTQAYKYVTDSLKIEFDESDDVNFQKNAITSKVEESNVLVVEQPLGFLKGNLTNV
jgi:HK97 family phage major capsid protein